jgi:hypothetical protein
MLWLLLPATAKPGPSAPLEMHPSHFSCRVTVSPPEPDLVGWMSQTKLQEVLKKAQEAARAARDMVKELRT